MMNLLGWIFLVGVTGIFLRIIIATAAGQIHPGIRSLGKGTLIVFWAVALLVLAIRFTRGLGAITAMTDAFPWGVWIGLLQSGVALSAGGYVIAATVHIFHIKRFEPILRPAVLTAFLGYSFVALTLFIEVGRPQRLWHPLVLWQHTSIMFEVAWCVTLYITVLMIEFSPVIFEKLNLPKAVHVLHLAAIPLVIAGVILSTLHQSSMGSMFLVMPEKIYPLWFSPLLPIFFLMSSVAVGLCMVMLESFFSFRVFGRELEHSLLFSLSRAARTVLVFYGLTKMADLTLRGAWPSLFANGWMGSSFGCEMILGILVPIFLFSVSKKGFRMWRLASGAGLAAAGVILNRLNVSWFSMIPYSNAHYIPTWMELSVSLFLLSVMVTTFGLAVRFLPVFPLPEKA